MVLLLVVMVLICLWLDLVCLLFTCLRVIYNSVGWLFAVSGLRLLLFGDSLFVFELMFGVLLVCDFIECVGLMVISSVLVAVG